MATPHNSDLNVLQECEQARTIPPERPLLRRRCAALRQRFRFHFQIDFCIDISGVQRHMSKPGADGIDVDPARNKYVAQVWGMYVVSVVFDAIPENDPSMNVRGA